VKLLQAKTEQKEVEKKDVKSQGIKLGTSSKEVPKLLKFFICSSEEDQHSLKNASYGLRTI